MPDLAKSVNSPIFIHSLWRCGSTYFFNVFRRSSHGYWAYQEPLHEVAVESANDPNHLLAFTSTDMAVALRHPVLDKPYFQELFEIHDFWKDKINKAIVYDQYFESHCTPELSEYIGALVSHAKGRPVIQECRTSSRIGALRERFDGVHVYAWRDPRDQWWSFKINNYFDGACQLIINAQPHPPVIARLRTEIGFQEFHDETFTKEFAFFYNHRVCAENGYLTFYLLWALALREGTAKAHLCLNVDRLSESAEYRDFVLEGLRTKNIEGIDLSDCRIHQSFYSPAEDSWYSRIEDRAHGLLMASGWSRSDVDTVTSVRRKYAKSLRRLNSNLTIKEDVKRSRQIAMRLQDDIEEVTNRLQEDLLHKETDLLNVISGLKESSNEALARAETEAGVRERRSCELLQQTIQMADKARNDVQAQLSEYGERERALRAELGAVRGDLERTRSEAAQRERTLTERTEQKLESARSEAMALQQQLGDRERALQAELGAVRDYLERTRSESAQRERTLTERTEQRLESARSEAMARRQQLGDRERALQAELGAVRDDFERTGSEAAQRERDFNAELLAQSEKCQALQRQLDDARREATTANEREAALRGDMAEQIARAARVAAEIAKIQQTLSWRLTAPLRRLVAPRIYRASRAEDESLADTSLKGQGTGGKSPTPEKSTRLPIEVASLEVARDEPLSISSERAPSIFPGSFSNLTILPGRLMHEIKHVDQLLELDDEEFVKSVYHVLLGRSPETTGMRNYIGHLRAGHGKAWVISDIAGSPEGMACDRKLAGLPELVAGQKETKHWLWTINSRAQHVERQMNRLENGLGRVTKHLTLMEYESMRRLHGLEQTIHSLQESIEKLKLTAMTETGISQATATTSGQDLPEMSTEAKRIFNELSSAIFQANAKRAP